MIDPTPVDAGNFPFIAQITTTFSRGVTGGSGAVIGPRILLTAGHVVFQPRFGGEPIRFEVNFAAGASRFQVSTDTWQTNTVWRDRDSRMPPKFQIISGADFGIVVLPQSIGDSVKPIPVSTTPDPMRNVINVGGYPIPPNGDLRTLYGANAPATSNAARIFYGIRTYEGMSGCPAYDIDNGIRCIRGIHTSIVSGQGSALRITGDVLALIDTWKQQFDG